MFIGLSGFQLSNNLGKTFLPIFPGKHYADQLNTILDVIGSPTMEDVKFVDNKKLNRDLLALPFMPKVSWKEWYPNGSPEVIDLLDKLLQLNPNNRATAEECLKHPFVGKYSDPNDEPVMKHPITYKLELKGSCTLEKIESLIFEESQKISKG